MNILKIVPRAPAIVSAITLAILAPNLAFPDSFSNDFRSTAFYDVAQRISAYQSDRFLELTERYHDHLASVQDRLDDQTPLHAFCALVAKVITDNNDHGLSAFEAYCANTEIDAASIARAIRPTSRPEGYVYNLEDDPPIRITSDHAETPTRIRDFRVPDAAVTFAEFIIDRAGQEFLSRFLFEIRNQLNQLRSSQYYAQLFPSVSLVLERLGELEADTIIPSLKSAAEDDMRQIPSRLTRIVATKTQRDQQHDAIHETLELVRNGMAPGLALQRLSSITPSTIESLSLRMTGLIAREWYYSHGIIGVVTLPYVRDHHGDEFYAELVEMALGREPPLSGYRRKGCRGKRLP